MGVNPSSDQPLDTEYLSPESVLETCFSTESLPSSSTEGDFLGFKTTFFMLDFRSHEFVFATPI